MPRALVVVNRASREGESDLRPGLALLRSRGFSLIEIYTAEPAAIPDTIRRHRDKVDLIVVGGGDGTLNTAAAAVRESGLPLGVVPMGTANDLARTLGIPPLAEEACRIIAGGRRRRIDLGEVNGQLFFNTASIGLAVRVTRRLTPRTKQRWGILAYGRALLGALRENRSFRADIVCDGHHLRHRSIQIAIGNGRHYGGGMTIAAEASLDDRLLHLYSLEPQSVWRLLRLLPALRSGEFRRRDGVLLMSGREIEIATPHPLPVDTDGELTTSTPARFRVVPAALTIFTPEQGAGGAGETDVDIAQ